MSVFLDWSMGRSLRIFFGIILVLATGGIAAAESAHPRLVVSSDDIVAMKQAVSQPGSFQSTYVQTKADVDAKMKLAVVVPYPKDAGGGYTHEKHKQNYKFMHDAGLMFLLSGDKKYAYRVRDMLFEYGDMYGTLSLHPKRKGSAPGKLFWQSLNEAVWLVYTIQAYDFILPALTTAEQQRIKTTLFDKVVAFISEQSPQTFDKIHNHGTWATAAVGMSGYVFDEPEWVERALLGLDKSGKGGYLRQLDELFSPEGYYNEGPYYQRYAMMPFMLFAKAIQVNEPERKIFEARDNILLKAIDTTLQLSYNGLFFPMNDAIKDKGIDTIELVYGVSIVYGLTGDKSLLSIAKRQGQILLTGDGLKVAQALDLNQQTDFNFRTVAFGDGASGKDGALVVLRDGNDTEGAAVVFKATSQGLGHGHFDKLAWQYYDNGQEILKDYGAARFLNVVSKSGGRYLKENKSYAKQSVAHNTLVVDEVSHFSAKTKLGNKNHPEILFFGEKSTGSSEVKAASAKIDTAYDNVAFSRTLAMINIPSSEFPVILDIVSAKSDTAHQYDLPVHYNGQLIDTNFTINSKATLKPLGNDFGYQHLWLKADAKPKKGGIQLSWLKDDRFYTHHTVTNGDIDVLFTELGANDPKFNLVPESAFILRYKKAKRAQFVSVLEAHGDYNPSKEYTKESAGRLKHLSTQLSGNIALVSLAFNDGKHYLFAYAVDGLEGADKAFTFSGKKYSFDAPFKLYSL